MNRALIALAVACVLLLASLQFVTAQGQSQQSAGSMRLTTLTGPVVTFTGFTFANIAGNIPNNGMVGYCSDCTIANPCAGGGTGAIAKRLNGVNVCN